MNKKATSCASTCRRTPTRCCRVADHCLRSRDYVNVIVAGKQPAPQWLTMDAAVRHCTAGAGIWDWASNDARAEPDVVMACAGDVPTMETLAAVDLLRRRLPDLKMRVVNVVDLMALQPPAEHPHGLADSDVRQPVHRRPAGDLRLSTAIRGSIHRLLHGRTNARSFHVHGFTEEGTTTTPFDMTVLNGLDRFTLALAAIERVPRVLDVSAHFAQSLRDKLVDHTAYVREHGQDLPEVRDWQWSS